MSMISGGARAILPPRTRAAAGAGSVGSLGRALRLLLAITITPLVLGIALPASGEDLERGRELFKLCAVCHGAAGQGNHEFSAPAIGGLPRWYLEAQLTKFKLGQRGYRGEDQTGLQMRPMARSLVTESDVAAVAAYVASLPSVRPPATLDGDPERGRAAYALCQTCHGERAAGNEALKAPALSRQADWYLATQIQKFRARLRGTHPGDTTGAQMQSIAMTLADDAAIRDVVAYIRSLGN